MGIKRRVSIGAIGKTIREVLAIAFWVHALCVSHLFPLDRFNLPAISLTTFNLALFAFIANYALFSNYGWISIIIDVGYIYFCPLIYLGRMMRFSARVFARHVRRTVVFNKPAIVLLANTPPAAPAKPTAKVETQPEQNATVNFWNKLLWMLAGYSLLWSIYVFTISYKPIIGFVAVLMIVGGFRSILTMYKLFSYEPRWFAKIEGIGEKVLQGHLDILLGWDGFTDVEKIKVQLNIINFYQAIFGFIRNNRAPFRTWALAASIVLSVPFYVYISYLFAVAYFGIGRIFGIDFSFSASFLDSLYMPFAWTDLPRNFPIRLLGGLQAVVVAAMGWTIGIRHLGQRIENLAIATDRLSQPFEENSVKERIVQVQRSVTAAPTVDAKG